MHKKFTILVFALILMVGAAFSQRSGSGIPQVIIKDKAKNTQYPLDLQQLDIRVDITENIATTTFDMIFQNNLNRILEGELNFPLGEGSTVSRFAMDVFGKLREGVVVEKNKGQKVFETIVRRRIDPGLLECTNGNNFKARIYPIPARGNKRIVIAYEHELKMEDDAYAYFLPLNLQNKIPKFSIEVSVYNQDVTPQVNLQDNSVNIPFEKWKNSYISNFQKTNYLPEKHISFLIPFLGKTTPVITDMGKTTQEDYFYVNIFPDKIQKPKVLPKHLCIFYDVSSSAMEREIDTEIELIKKYAQSIENAHIDFITFSNEIVVQKHFEITAGNTDSLVAEISQLSFDGGTQLGVLDFAKYPCDEILLFSDGISNFGKKDVHLSSTPIRVVNTSYSADHAYLKYMATQTAGNYINMNSLDIKEAIDILTTSNWQFISSEYDKSQISEVYPSIPTRYDRNFTVSGKLKTDQATIKLNFGHGNKILYTKEIAISSENMSNTGLVERIWVQKKIAELKLQYEKNKEQITELGKKYAVVTPSTSLIVLESIRDYLEFEIIPPDDMKEEYFKQLAARKERYLNQKNNKLNNVIHAYNKKIRWWKHEPVILPKIRERINEREINISTAMDTVEFDGNTNQSSERGQGALKGKVLDSKTNEPIPFANVVVQKDSEQITGATTDFDGRYTIRPLNSGTYDIVVTYVGYQPLMTSQVPVESGRITYCNIKIHASMTMLDEVEITNYKVPLISKDQTQSGGTVTSDAIMKMPGRDASSIAATVGGVYNEDNDMNVRGSRSESTVIYIDGVQVRGSSSVPKSAIDQVQVVMGGLPAKYGGDDINQNNTTPPIINSPSIHTTSFDYSSASYGNSNEAKPLWIKKIKCKDKSKLYANYLSLKEEFGKVPAFLLAVADDLNESKQAELALRVLSNIAELELENHELMRILARRLQQLGEFEYAIYIFEKLLELRAEEPQAYRDLGLAYASNGEYQKAIDMLYQVIEKDWNFRFPEIENIVIGEINAIIAKADTKLDISNIDKNLLENLPVDIRVVLNWDADNTDMDLWVTDPNGEKCFYANRDTKLGGTISRDFTGGYGPEEFLLKDAKPGKYKVQVDYYGTSQRRVAGPVTLQVQMFTNYGTPQEKMKEVTLQLSSKSQVVDVGTFYFKETKE